VDQVRIGVKAAGPLILNGPAVIVDPQGGEWEIPAGESVGLCRCGHSKRKPFCDKSHFEQGFDHPEPVNPDTLPPVVKRRQ
jgi:CDGSH iron-sulfur domain-containing protein 3